MTSLLSESTLSTASAIPGLVLRPEQPSDIPTITCITREAFSANPHGEEVIVTKLRDDNALTLSIVATVPPYSKSPLSSPSASPPPEVEEGQEKIAAHVAFSPVTLEGVDENWVGLGPVSVSTSLQRKGLGSAVIREGLRILRERGDIDGCVVLGNPAFYGKFGFQAGQGLVLDGVPAKYFQSLSFGDSRPEAKVRYHAAFGV